MTEKWGVHSLERRRTAVVGVRSRWVCHRFSMVINTTGHAKELILVALEMLMDSLCIYHINSQLVSRKKWSLKVLKMNT